MASRVFVGLSGGVDSSVSAALLVEQGYEVVGVYMKNWAKDLPGFKCPWREDLADAKRVAVQLGIPFTVFDFQDQYKQKVVDYLIDGYRKGLTPNPDIMCNQEIKFKLFLETALEQGADKVATGHYARIKDDKLQTAKDQSKDQSYFLYRMPKTSIKKTIFPLGELTKKQVRQLATDKKLVTASKKESMGICFVGKVDIKEFLSQYIQPKTGEIIDQSGAVVGQHDGAWFYTIGQRHGLGVGGGLPYYVINKDIKKNQITVTTDLDSPKLWSKQLKLTDCHWLVDNIDTSKSYHVRIRHQGPLIDTKISRSAKDTNLILGKEIRALTAGQSAVIYDGQTIIGGGIII